MIIALIIRCKSSFSLPYQSFVFVLSFSFSGFRWNKWALFYHFQYLLALEINFEQQYLTLRKQYVLIVPLNHILCFQTYHSSTLGKKKMSPWCNHFRTEVAYLRTYNYTAFMKFPRRSGNPKPFFDAEV